jgi:hypothetical protein
MLTISFEGIVKGRDSTIRVTADGLLSAVDLVMVVTGKDRDHSGKMLRRLPERDFSSDNFIQRMLSTHGGCKTKLVTLHHAAKLVMVLPGKSSKRYQKQFADILIRYLDGDLSMCSEIANNNAMGRAESYRAFAQKVSDQVDETSVVPTQSWVYCASSAAFPGLVKIGKTEDLKARLSSANTFCAPSPFAFDAIVPTFDSKRDETLTHEHFNEFRRDGEFFEISAQSVREFFAAHIMPAYQRELAEIMQKFQS